MDQQRFSYLMGASNKSRVPTMGSQIGGAKYGFPLNIANPGGVKTTTGPYTGNTGNTGSTYSLPFPPGAPNGQNIFLSSNQQTMIQNRGVMLPPGMNANVPGQIILNAYN